MGKLVYLNQMARDHHIKIDMVYLKRDGATKGMLMNLISYNLLKDKYPDEGGVEIKHFKVKESSYNNIVATHPEFIDYFTVKTKVLKSEADK